MRISIKTNHNGSYTLFAMVEGKLVKKNTLAELEMKTFSRNIWKMKNIYYLRVNKETMKKEYNILGQTMLPTDSEFNKIAIRSYNDMIRAKDTHDEAVERIAEHLRYPKRIRQQ